MSQALYYRIGTGKQEEFFVMMKLTDILEWESHIKTIPIQCAGMNRIFHYKIEVQVYKTCFYV